MKQTLAGCIFLIPYLGLNAQDFRELEEKLEQRYTVTIEYNVERKDTWNMVTMDSVNDLELTTYLGLLDKAIAKYPKDYFTRIGLSYLHIGKNLKFEGVNRSAVPDNYNNVLFLALSAPERDYSDHYLVHCFHHELNHYVEFHMWGSYRHKWDPWTALYDTTNSKGGEYAYSNSGNWYPFDQAIPGFSNMYSTLGQEEDRSEVIAFFLTDENQQHDEVIMKSKVDTTYFNKCNLLFNYYGETLNFTSLQKAWNREIKKFRQKSD